MHEGSPWATFAANQLMRRLHDKREGRMPHISSFFNYTGCIKKKVIELQRAIVSELLSV
jgi:hypothetical protein